MVLETSAAMAISMEEAGFEALEEKLAMALNPPISAVSYMEASTVLISKRGPGGPGVFDTFLADYNVEIVAVDVSQAKIAREAHSKFGKDRGHRAQLNMGDCFSYALAKQRSEPLLFVGIDFIHTDVVRA